MYRIMHFCTKFTFYYKWFTIMYTFISFSLEFDGIIFGIAFDPYCSIYSFFSMRFVSFLHSYFTSYHSQTFAVEKACVSAFCGKNRLELSYLVHILHKFLSEKLKISWTILCNFVLVIVVLILNYANEHAFNSWHFDYLIICVLLRLHWPRMNTRMLLFRLYNNNFCRKFETPID